MRRHVHNLTADWPLKRLENFVLFYASGKTWPECAAAFDTNPNTLRSLYYSSVEARAIRKRLNVPRQCRIRFWTDEKIEAVLLMHYKQGVSFEACAEAVGRPESNIRRIIFMRRGQKFAANLGLQKFKKRALDLVGRKFGRLKVLARVGFRPHANGSGTTIWLCKCSCGVSREVVASNLTRGKTRSCGQHRPSGKKASQYKNGHWCGKMRPLRVAFGTMHRRCRDLNNANYGGRGIRVAPDWSNTPEGFARFLHDMKIPNGRRPRGMSLDRIDVDGPYSVENCKWSTDKEQANNKQVHKRARVAFLANDLFEPEGDLNPY